MTRREATTAVLRAGALLSVAWAVPMAILEDLTRRSLLAQLAKAGLPGGSHPSWLREATPRAVGVAAACLIFVLADRIARSGRGADERLDTGHLVRLATLVAGLWLVVRGLTLLASLWLLDGESSFLLVRLRVPWTAAVIALVAGLLLTWRPRALRRAMRALTRFVDRVVGRRNRARMRRSAQEFS